MSPSPIHAAGPATPRPAVVAFLLFLLVAGFALRIWHVGSLGLVADEGHQAMAVEGILEHGYPLVPSENIYLRGAPFLYAEAVAARLGGVNEFTLRLPAALFGALSVLATFLFARRLFGTQVALLAATLLAFSAWGLELARYARMYTLLQFLFVMSAHAFVRGYLDDRRFWRLSCWFLMGLAIVTHQLGVMILLVFLLPAFLPEETLPANLRGGRRYALALPAVVLGVGWLLVHKLVGRLMVRTATATGDGSGDSVAPGLLGLIEQHLRIPEMTMPLNLLGDDRQVVLIAAAALGVLAVSILIAGLRHGGIWLRTLVCLGILGAAFMNLFAVALGLVGLALILFDGGWRKFARAPWSIALVGAAGFALYWGIYLHLHPAELDPGWGEPWSIWRAFTAYPPVKSRVLDWFLTGWPRMTALVGVGLLTLAALFLADRKRQAAIVALGVIVMPLVAATFGREVFNEVRYHFHLYPFILIVFAAVLVMLARAVTAGLDILLALARQPFGWRRPMELLLVGALAFACSRDVSPTELALLVNRDYTTTKDPIRATLNWRPYALFHQDHVSPSQYVREHLEPGDLVVFFGPTYWASIYRYYIGRVDFAISEKASRIVRDGHVVHHVTGVRCLTSLAELEAMLAAESGRRIWLLGDRNMLSDTSASFSPEMKARLSELATPWHYLGRDLNTLVRRIDPHPGSTAERSGAADSGAAEAGAADARGAAAPLRPESTRGLHASSLQP